MKFSTYQSPFSQSDQNPDLTTFEFVMQVSIALGDYLDRHRIGQDLMMEFQMLNTALNEFVVFFENNNLKSDLLSTENDQALWNEIRDSIKDVGCELTIENWERRLNAIRAFIKDMSLFSMIKQVLGLN